MIKKICDFIDSIFIDAENKNWKLFISKILILLLAFVTLFMIGCCFIDFCYKYIDYIAIGVGAVLAIIWGIYFLLCKFRDLFRKQDNPTPQQNTTAPYYDPYILDQTYDKLKEGFFVMIREIADVIHVAKPTRSSQLEAHIHHSIVENSPIYHFLLAKSGKECDIENIHAVLERRIEQMLNNHEFPDITQTNLLYNGQAYPYIMIDKIRDLQQYIQIDVAIANKYYCQYQSRKGFNKVNASPIDVELDDTDF